MSVFKKFDTRVLLWLLFCVQIFLIGLILGFGSILYSDEAAAPQPLDTVTPVKDYAIRFITKDAKALTAVEDKELKGEVNYHILGEKIPVPFKSSSIGNPFETFASVWLADQNDTLWCFREGTVAKGDSSWATEFDEKLGVVRCRCKADWHGTDCGQPEVVWRSLFAAKATVTTERRARNIYYIIRTSEFSLETLELQIMELVDVVDVFVLCFGPAMDLRKIRRFLSTTDHFKNYSGRMFLRLEKEKCVSHTLLGELEKSLSRSLDEEELVLMSDQDEILNRKAINYLKWYNDGHDMFRFRLKHVVYGFFWMHPKKTILRSVMVKYKLLVQSRRLDLEQLAQVENNSRMQFLVIGDLNHFGGWFCQLCYQPLDMIAFLGQELRANEKTRARHRSGVIDEEFATKLIANGVNIYELLAREEMNFEKTSIPDGGGPMDLVKLYPSAEKHYSPSHVKKGRGHFDNIIRNLFARWELDVVDDYNYYN